MHAGVALDCRSRELDSASSAARIVMTGAASPYDIFGDHAELCSTGSSRYKVHNALCGCLARFTRQSGVEAEREEVCSKLLQ